VADVEFTIERDGYATIRLLSDGGGPYGFQTNTQGLGVGPVVPQFRDGVGDGARFDGDTVGAKPMDLGITVQGDDRLHTGKLIRNLRNLMRWRKNQPLPRLVATWANGDILEVPFTYTSGLEQDYTNALPWRFDATVAVMCPDPYWTARSALSFSVEPDTSATPFLDDLAQLPVASSNAMGSRTVTNSGDVAADLTVIIKGPTTGLTTVLVNGIGWVFKTALSAAETITVERSPLGVTVTDQLGANRYADLAAAPKFPQLPPGDSTVFISMLGAVAGSRASGFWKNRYEGVY